MLNQLENSREDKNKNDQVFLRSQSFGVKFRWKGEMQVSSENQFQKEY